MSSFPVPVSPSMRTVESVGTTCSTWSRTDSRAALLPMIGSNLRWGWSPSGHVTVAYSGTRNLLSYDAIAVAISLTDQVLLGPFRPTVDDPTVSPGTRPRASAASRGQERVSRRSFDAHSRPSARRLPLIENLTIQGVRKFVTLRSGPVRERTPSCPPHHVLPARQVFTSAFEFLLVHGRAEDVCIRRERHARHARELQHSLLVRAQFLDLEFDHLPQGLRRLQMNALEWQLDLPRPVFDRDHTPVSQVVHYGHHE